jgi:hypothetical protein
MWCFYVCVGGGGVEGVNTTLKLRPGLVRKNLLGTYRYRTYLRAYYSISRYNGQGRRLFQPMSYIKACQVRRTITFVGDLSSSYDAAVFFLTWRDYSERECDIRAPISNASYVTPVNASLRKGMNAAESFLEIVWDVCIVFLVKRSFRLYISTHTVLYIGTHTVLYIHCVDHMECFWREKDRDYAVFLKYSVRIFVE